MELKRSLALVGSCMRMLEEIPWPDNPESGTPPFYSPADGHLARAYQELDEAEGQLRSAVREQEAQPPPGGSTPYLNALIEYTGEVLHSTRGSDTLAMVHGMSPEYGKANTLFNQLPGWIRDKLLKAQNAREEEKESV